MLNNCFLHAETWELAVAVCVCQLLFLLWDDRAEVCVPTRQRVCCTNRWSSGFLLEWRFSSQRNPDKESVYMQRNLNSELQGWSPCNAAVICCSDRGLVTRLHSNMHEPTYGGGLTHIHTQTLPFTWVHMLKKQTGILVLKIKLNLKV